MKKMDEREKKIKSFMENRIWVFIGSFVLAYVFFGIGLIFGASTLSFIVVNGIWTFVMVALAIDTKATILRIFNDEQVDE